MSHEKATFDPDGYIDYRYTLGTVDGEGNSLNNVKGAEIEVLEPGASEWRYWGFVPLPYLHARIPVGKDGTWCVRSRTKNGAQVGNSTEGLSVGVNLSIPAAGKDVAIDTAVPHFEDPRVA